MKKKIVHGSTFSGIGAPEIAADMLGWENAFHCEINPFGRSILDFYYPESKSYEDITKTDFSEWRDRIDVLTGGFPCQPFSYAGKRKGSEDDRYLWPFMLKCIEQVRPTWFVGENVAGIGTMVFPGEEVKMGSNADIFEPGDIYRTEERFVLHEIIKNLESVGYSVQPFVIPACAVGAPHRRDRVFIIARRNEDGFSFADTHSRNNATRIAGKDACEGGEERLQERNQVQQPIKPADARSEMFGASTDTACGGCGTPGKGGETERIRRGNDGKPEERGGASERTDGLSPLLRDATNAGIEGLERGNKAGGCKGEKRMQIWGAAAGCRGKNTQRIIEGMQPHNRWRTFPSISAVYRGNDGIPFDVDGLSIPFSRWKKESLKAYGNAIVVQVMYEIFRCIDAIENGND